MLKIIHSFISQTLIKNQLSGVYSVGWIKNTKIAYQYDIPALYSLIFLFFFFSLIFLSPSSAQATRKCETPNVSPYWCLDKH